MEAREYIEGQATFGPDARKAISEAFDEAWQVIGGNFNPDTIAGGRIRLADALLSIANENSRDVARLKRGALEAMALTYYANQSDRDLG